MTDLQVKDDPALLQLMNEDMRKASRFYNPTNYWAFYEKTFLPELEKLGLHDFRRRKNSVLRSFGATDLIEKPLVDIRKNRLLHNRMVNSIPGWGGVQRAISSVANGFLGIFPGWKNSLRTHPFRVAKAMGVEMDAPPLEALDISLAGHPEDVFMAEEKQFTNSMLYYYMRYAFGAGHIDLETASTLVELGSGSGKNVEIVMNYHPHLTYLVFDISPQLYVCEQYLKTVFPGRVISYRENRERQSMMGLLPGKIYIFGAWHFPLLENFKFDVFWNCASLQEMEPDVALNYLSYVNKSARLVYLMAKMDGKLKAKKPGEPGVIEPVTLEHYKWGLSDFEMDAIANCFYPDGTKMWDGYKESVWFRK